MQTGVQCMHCVLGCLYWLQPLLLLTSEPVHGSNNQSCGESWLPAGPGGSWVSLLGGCCGDT